MFADWWAAHGSHEDQEAWTATDLAPFIAVVNKYVSDIAAVTQLRPALDPDVFWLPEEPERDYSGERGQ